MSSNDRIIRRASDPEHDRRLAVGAVQRATASLSSAARASRAMIRFAATVGVPVDQIAVSAGIGVADVEAMTAGHNVDPEARLRRNLEVVSAAARERREAESWLEAAVRAAVAGGADDDAILRALE